MRAAGPDRPRQTIAGVDASEQSDLRHPQCTARGSSSGPQGRTQLKLINSQGRSLSLRRELGLNPVSQRALNAWSCEWRSLLSRPRTRPQPRLNLSSGKCAISTETCSPSDVPFEANGGAQHPAPQGCYLTRRGRCINRCAIRCAGGGGSIHRDPQNAEALKTSCVPSARGLDVLPLPTHRNLDGFSGAEEDYQRISVACGLAQDAFTLGRIVPAKEVEDDVAPTWTSPSTRPDRDDLHPK